ncbi:GNAT family N-acetyltransferase [Jannaschia sp. 2305UL9-9]|uniref:GNAT family N-acetyltransferase n=1 Tax=Jannaschia sp. 2305UL9-9 TaxID=3121638 RepID=UPI003527355B
MLRSELDTVLDWAAAEGWNPGLDDADAFWAADPEGFFVAEEDGTPVAAISVVRHDEDYAFLGLYICRPSHRGQGAGLSLWQHAMAHAGKRIVGLDGVPAQQDNYARSGFRPEGKTVRHVGSLAPLSAGDIRRASDRDIPVLVALEAKASGRLKPAYMRAWFAGAHGRQTFVQYVDDMPTGAVTIRRCREGAKIGPLIAPDRTSAMALLGAAAAYTPGPLSIDVPGGAEGFGEMLRREGFEPSFETARMYAGGTVAPGIAPPVLFAVTSLELG